MITSLIAALAVMAPEWTAADYTRMIRELDAAYAAQRAISPQSDLAAFMKSRDGLGMLVNAGPLDRRYYSTVRSHLTRAKVKQMNLKMTAAGPILGMPSTRAKLLAERSAAIADQLYAQCMPELRGPRVVFKWLPMLYCSVAARKEKAQLHWLQTHGLDR